MVPIREIQDAVLRRSDGFETLIVITSNHGGYGNGHEEWMRPTAQVPIVFANPRHPINVPGDKGWGGWLDIKEVVPSVLGAMGVPRDVPSRDNLSGVDSAFVAVTRFYFASHPILHQTESTVFHGS
ncbi:hypothetical protein FOZ63_002122 [Perkinsus olseni]|uniref:Uncharacterized protein n=1 Tax=Perkinsus olseni TaxID=32597 RepID=A0A7J6PQB7_PEROL|nr:hypothetical protein FOZ62_017875 [Perkinsus olseni]KAF4744856.1 hypothetical protein FOZ63_002122 [Perkinsus olseni]